MSKFDEEREMDLNEMVHTIKSNVARLIGCYVAEDCIDTYKHISTSDEVYDFINMNLYQPEADDIDDYGHPKLLTCNQLHIPMDNIDFAYMDKTLESPDGVVIDHVVVLKSGVRLRYRYDIRYLSDDSLLSGFADKSSFEVVPGISSLGRDLIRDIIKHTETMGWGVKSKFEYSPYDELCYIQNVLKGRDGYYKLDITPGTPKTK